MQGKLIFTTRRLFRFEKSSELPGWDTTTTNPTTTTITTTTTSEVTRFRMRTIKRKNQEIRNSKWID